MKVFLTTLIVFIFVLFCNAQHIESRKGFGGQKFYVDGQKVSLLSLDDYMQSNPEALNLMAKARTNYTLGLVVNSLGGGLVGFPIGTYLASKKADWNIALAGAGLIVLSVPILMSANRKAHKAVETYNASLGAQTTFYEVKFIANGNGLGLCLKF